MADPNKNTIVESETAAREKAILDFWVREKIFEKSVEKEGLKGDYIFYDGPPFATGLPHHGHIVASVNTTTARRYHPMACTSRP